MNSQELVNLIRDGKAGVHQLAEVEKRIRARQKMDNIKSIFSKGLWSFRILLLFSFVGLFVQGYNYKFVQKNELYLCHARLDGTMTKVFVRYYPTFLGLNSDCVLQYGTFSKADRVEYKSYQNCQDQLIQMQKNGAHCQFIQDIKTAKERLDFK